jgi:glucosamine--fructose-6-phosphate aminotransferase (isomerizing)
MSALDETIHAQAEQLEALLAADLADAPGQLAGARHIWLIGTGTSQHAAELGALMFSEAEIPVTWHSGAGFASAAPRLSGEDAVVVISHTAETLFARRARERAQQAGARLVSITGRRRGWPEAIETVEPERAETYTASYLTALLVLARLASAAGMARFTPSQLDALPRLVAGALDAGAPRIESPERLLVVIGAGPGAVTAREGALKLREAARLAAEGYEAEYLLHGNAVPLDLRDGLIVLAPATDPEGHVELIAQAGRREGLAVTDLREPSGVDPVLAQLPMTVSLQLLAAKLAAQGGQDPDEVIVGAWADPRLWPTA